MAPPQCRRLTVAVAGDLSTVEGAGIANGAQLAVDQHNAKEPRMPTRPRARRFAGQHGHRAQPGQTTRLHPGRHRRHRAHHLVGCGSRRPALQRGGVGLLEAVGHRCHAHRQGWKTFFRGINNDDVEGESLARHLTGTLMRKRVCVISDNGESAAGLARAVTQGLGSAAVESCSSITPTGTVDIPARVADITKAGADGVFFAGSRVTPDRSQPR